MIIPVTLKDFFKNLILNFLTIGIIKMHGILHSFSKIMILSIHGSSTLRWKYHTNFLIDFLTDENILDLLLRFFHLLFKKVLKPIASITNQNPENKNSHFFLISLLSLPYHGSLVGNTLLSKILHLLLPLEKSSK